MIQRRKFLKAFATTAAGSLFYSNVFPLCAGGTDNPVTFGIISDLHHLQFKNREEQRLQKFMEEVQQVSPDFIVQCGDFCRPEQSEGVMREWNRFGGPKYHVLGNHDMDVCDKPTIMRLWGMEKRYYSFDNGGYHFVVMDRNFLKKDDNSLVDYNTSNWSPYAGPFRSFTDEAQLEWLKKDLSANKKPAIIFMHQPVFLSDYFNELGNADDILDIFDDINFAAGQHNSNGKVVAVFMGHDHDDRYGVRNNVHYFIINSATYVYNQGPHYFKDSIFAFVTLQQGKLFLQGRQTVYRDEVPIKIKKQFPTTIHNRSIML
ncbi:MAG: metallophosphoesterase family protein [Agriterribacter sp.]